MTSQNRSRKKSGWVALTDAIPASGQFVFLANKNRRAEGGTHGCVKDVGVLRDAGVERYWSTQGRARVLPFEEFTHWMAVGDP